MKARLVLLRGGAPGDRVSWSYTVQLLADDGTPVTGDTPNELYARFKKKSYSWHDKRFTSQRQELKLQLSRVQEFGPRGMKWRNERTAKALPEDRERGWEHELPIQLLPLAPHLKGLPAIRLYVLPLEDCVIYFDGNVKHTRRAEDADSGVHDEFFQANAIARTLRRLRRTQQLTFLPNGQIDLARLGNFDY